MASPAYPPGTSASSASSAASSASAAIVRPAAFSATQTGAPTLPRATLILGGARSGKSSYAERLIDGARDGNDAKPLYIATAEARDAEMVERIRLHCERRGAAWETIEEPFDLAGALRANAGRTILVDCLTLWLTNLLLAERDIAAEREQLAATVAGFSGAVVLVANEVGLGILPENALARRFRDEAGILNQAIAKVCDRVIFMAAGLPMVMKDDSAAASAGAVR